MWVLTLFTCGMLVTLLSSLFCFAVYVAARFEWDKGEFAGTTWREFDDNPDKYRRSQPDDKMILWWIRFYGSHLPPFYRKPVYLCMTCMGSLWSLPLSVVFTLLLLPEWYHIFIAWPVFTATTAGLNSWLAFNLETE